MDHVTLEDPRIYYKETVAAAVEGVGHYEPLRHYAEVHLLLEPLPRGSGLVFDSTCSTDILEALKQGHITYVLNTQSHNNGTMNDGIMIRRAAVENNVTIFTSLDTVAVLLDVLEEITVGVSTIDS